MTMTASTLLAFRSASNSKSKTPHLLTMHLYQFKDLPWHIPSHHRSQNQHLQNGMMLRRPNSNMNGNGKMNRNNGMMVNKVVVANPKKVYLSKVKKVGVITGSGFGLGKAKGLSWVDEPFRYN